VAEVDQVKDHTQLQEWIHRASLENWISAMLRAALAKEVGLWLG